MVTITHSNETLLINTTQIPLCVICGNFSERVTLPRQLRIQNAILYDIQEVDMTGYEVVVRNLTSAPLLVGKKNSIVCVDFGNIEYSMKFYTESKFLL